MSFFLLEWHCSRVAKARWPVAAAAAPPLTDPFSLLFFFPLAQSCCCFCLRSLSRNLSLAVRRRLVGLRAPPLPENAKKVKPQMRQQLAEASFDGRLAQFFDAFQNQSSLNVGNVFRGLSYCSSPCHRGASRWYVSSNGFRISPAGPRKTCRASFVLFPHAPAVVTGAECNVFEPKGGTRAGEGRRAVTRPLAGDAQPTGAALGIPRNGALWASLRRASAVSKRKVPARGSQAFVFIIHHHQCVRSLVISQTRLYTAYTHHPVITQRGDDRCDHASPRCARTSHSLYQHCQPALLYIQQAAVVPAVPAGHTYWVTWAPN